MAISKAGWVRLRVYTVLPVLIAFVILSLNVTDDVAQDRWQYFVWYLNAGSIIHDLDARDLGFTYMLHLMPVDMTPEMFSASLTAITFLLMTAVVASLARRGIISWDYLPLVLLIAVCDRLYIDLSLNTTRGTIALLIFMQGLLSGNSWLRLSLMGLAFGFHLYVAMMMSVIYVMSWMLRSWPHLVRFLVFAGIIAFCIRVVTDNVLIPWVETTDPKSLGYESESVTRGLTTFAPLTESLLAQVGVALLVPLMMTQWFRRMGTHEYFMEPAGDASSLRLQLATMVLVSLGLALLVYPDFVLAQRIFVLPMLILPCMVELRLLKPLVVFKLILFGVVIFGNID
ncbi:MAG: hypothetical protein ABIC92_17425 [Pseudomonadota bacterium]